MAAAFKVFLWLKITINISVRQRSEAVGNAAQAATGIRSDKMQFSQRRRRGQIVRGKAPGGLAVPSAVQSAADNERMSTSAAQQSSPE